MENKPVVHTPTPWHLEPKQGYAFGANGQKTITCHTNRADRDYAVRAVNAYEELLNGLKDALSFIRDDRQCLSKRCGHYEKSDCIDTFIADKIAEAEGK